MGIHHITAIAGEPQRNLDFYAGALGLRLVRYFRSVYFREPGGVLFEIATDAPGFTIDEPAAELGARLMLPPMYEARRRQIEGDLPAVRLPQSTVRQEK